MRPDSTIQWTAYPALLAAGAFAAGILGAELGGIHNVYAWWMVGLGGVGLWMGAAWWAHRRLVTLAPLLRTLGLALLVSAAGGLRATVYRTPPPNALAPVAAHALDQDQSVTLLGTVAGPPSRGEASVRFTLEVEQVVASAGTVSVGGRVRTTMRSPPWKDAATPFPVVHAGDQLRARGELRPGPSPRNPADFDYGAYLARRGICCTMRVGIPANVAVLDRDASAIGAALVATRTYVRRHITRHVSHREPQAVLQALLLGDRARLSERVEEQFAATGLMHLLAVSGLHVLLVGFVLYGLLRPLLTRCRFRWQTVEILRAVATIIVLMGYMGLTGARPSVVRAVVMATLLIGGIVLQRSAPTLNTLGVAMLVLLAVRPPALLDVGFQLSMSAVAGIVTLSDRFTTWLPEEWTRTAIGDATVQTTVVSLAATIATGPVLLYHFGRVPLAGLVLNTAAIPLTALGLTAGIVTALAGPIAAVGASFGAAADMIVRLLLWVAEMGDAWMGWAHIPGSRVGLFSLGIWIAGTIALAQWPRPRHRWRCLIAGVLFLAAGAWTPIMTGDASPHLDVIFFDVGQGDAALVRTPAGSNILIDAGPRTRYADAGASVIVPHLRHAGIDHLDAVIVSHPDGDHLGGLPSVLRSVSVGRVLHSGWEATTELFAETRVLIDSLSVPHHAVDAGDTLRVDDSVQIDVLAPPPRPRQVGLTTKNDASVVLRLAYGSTTMLFTGDVEAPGEQWLDAAYKKQLAADVVKIPHHGSKTSSTPSFVQYATMDSSHAVVSAGRDNAFGMPHAGILARWRMNGAIVHETMQGAVWTRSDGTSFRTVSWREP